MTYIEEIESLIKNVNKQIVDFDKERIRGTAPTQVSSEFLTNKEQGDWAEKTFMDGINNNSDKYLDGILTQIADAFKFTRYPDFYNYNMNYKYCLKFLLAFAQGLQSNIERNLNVTYYSEPTFDLNNLLNKGKK